MVDNKDPKNAFWQSHERTKSIVVSLNNDPDRMPNQEARMHVINSRWSCIAIFEDGELLGYI